MSEIIIYKTSDNQAQIDVSDRDIKTIGKHINNVFEDGELDKLATVANFATVQKEGNRKIERQIEYYNLDVIISVGYRGKIATRRSVSPMGCYYS